MKTFQCHLSVDVILVVILEFWAEELRPYANQFGITKLR